MGECQSEELAQRVRTLEQRVQALETQNQQLTESVNRLVDMLEVRIPDLFE